MDQKWPLARGLRLHRLLPCDSRRHDVDAPEALVPRGGATVGERPVLQRRVRLTGCCDGVVEDLHELGGPRGGALAHLAPAGDAGTLHAVYGQRLVAEGARQATEQTASLHGGRQPQT